MKFSTDSFNVSTSDGHNFVLLEPFTWTARSGEVITVLAGSTSDGASTPRLGWNLLPPFGEWWKAAFLHDCLYRFMSYPKDQCDQWFREALEDSNVDLMVIELLYKAVCLGGANSFNTDRAAQALHQTIAAAKTS